MAIEVFDFPQGTPEWFQARLGLPTASEFQTVLPATDVRGKKSRQSYMDKLAGEIITGQPMESYSNPYMERGKMMEDDARRYYAFDRGTDIKQVGFVKNGRAGASPDGLIGEDGLLEIKTKAPHLLLPLMRTGEFPPEHRAQCQGALWITGRKWIDLVVYWPKFPLFVIRAQRDEGYIANLAGNVIAFNHELDEVVAFVNNYQLKAEAA